MPRNTLQTIMLLGCLATGGCADVWIKPGATEAELADNKEWCNNAAMKEHPPRVVEYKVHDAYVTPVDTHCSKRGDKIDCKTSGGELVQAQYSSSDENESPRRTYVRRCMSALGWVLKGR